MPRKVTRPVPGTNINYNPFFLLSFIVLQGVVFLTPYFRGLFFKTEQQPVLVILAITCAVWWFYLFKNKKFAFFTNPLDFPVCGLLIMYIISTFTAGSQSLAVNEVVKYAIYFFTFWLFSRLVLDEEKLKIALHVILFSAVGVALAGILTAMGLVDIKDGFLENMICSTMQYHNALAAYLLTAFILGLSLWLNVEKNGKILVAISNYIIFLTFFGANSRGAFILVPVVFVLSLLNPLDKDKLETLSHWIIVGVGSLVGNIGLIPNIVAGKMGQAWLWLFLGLIVTVLGTCLYNYLQDRKKINFTIKTLHIFIAITILAVIFAFTWQLILPEQIVERVKAINLQEENAVERIFWSMEAFQMIAENPLLGLGGGAWEAARFHFQSYYYQSTQVHNHFAQVLMEVGYPGLFIFISLWIVMLYLGFKNLKKVSTSVAKIQWLVMLAALALGAHALIDFDLSLSAITIVLFALFGITAAIYQWNYSLQFKIPANVFTGGLSAVFILALFLLPTSLMVARENITKGVSEFKNNNINSAIEYFEKAVSFDPFNAEYRIDLAQFYEKDGQLEKADEMIEQALQKDRFNWKISRTAGRIYWNRKEYETAVKYFEKARDNFKWNIDRWNELAQVYAFAGMINLEEGQFKEAEKYLQLAAEIPAEIERRMAEVGQTELKLWRRTPHLSASAQINLYAGIGEYFTGSIEQAQKYLASAAEQGEKEALVWLGYLLDKNGKKEEAQKYLQEAEKAYAYYQEKLNQIENLDSKKK